MEFILKIIVTPIILVLCSKLMKGVYVKNLKSAVYTSLWIIGVGFLIGWLLTLLFNVLTLGIFWILGLGIITRTLAYAIIIEIVDQARSKFNTIRFQPSVVLAIILAVAWTIIGWVA